MNPNHATGAEGQSSPAPATVAVPPAQLREVLRVLEGTQSLFSSVKAKVAYACGEGHLLASDEGRQYLARVFKSLDDEHRAIRATWPRLTGAMEVARQCSRAAMARAAAGGAGPAAQPGGPAGGSGAAAAPAGSAAPAHCRAVAGLLEGALAAEALPLAARRPAKRLRIGGEPAAEDTPARPAPAAPASAGGPRELLGVLLRVRAAEGGAGTLGGPYGGPMRLHALDDAGTVLHLPSALAATAAAAGGVGPEGPGGGGGWLGGLEEAAVAAGAARLVNATQVRMLLPGVLVANVVLGAGGCAAPCRVAVDCADKAFDLDPWAAPTTQVFRRLSALATRVLAFYTKRAEAAQPPPGAAAAPGPAAPSPGLPPAPASAGGAALEELLLWLAGCRGLFAARCAATGRLLALDPSAQYPVPPVFRPFKLPRAELLLRARDPLRGPAYHMHAAPLAELGWGDADVLAEALSPGGPVGAAAGAGAAGAGGAVAQRVQQPGGSGSLVASPHPKHSISNNASSQQHPGLVSL